MIFLDEQYFRNSALSKLRLFESELKLNSGFIGGFGPFEMTRIGECVLRLAYGNQKIVIESGTNGDDKSDAHRSDLAAMLALQAEVRVNGRTVDLGPPTDDTRRIGDAVTATLKESDHA
jgi:hypothetical protein